MLSETLRLLRVFHDMKQNELAERLGVSKSYVSEIENGNRTPSMEVIERYAATFKVPVSSVMFFAENLEDAKNQKGAAGKAKRAISSKIVNFLQLVEDRTELDGVR